MSDLVVDIHSHYYPPSYVMLLRSRSNPPQIVGDRGAERFVIFPGEHGRPIGDEYWELRRKLAFMEQYGIGQTVLSLGNPWLDAFTGPESPSLAREINQEFSALEGETGGRIVGLGVLPTDDIASAVKITKEIASMPSLYGVVSGPRICGRLLDDPELDSLWEALEKPRLPLLLHPHYTAAGDDLHGYGHALPVALGFPFETTIAVARLIFAGVLQRFPQLRIIASHAGGTIPFLAGRLDASWRSDPSVHGKLPIPPSSDQEKLFLDALVYHPRSLRAVADLVSTDRMAFGTDHPFSVAEPQTNLDAIHETFDEADQRRVLGMSATEYLRLPQPRI